MAGTSGARRGSGGERRPWRQLVVPAGQLRMRWSPPKLAIAQLQTERDAERYLRHVERPPHIRMADLLLPEVHHAPRALGFVRHHAGRTLVLGTRKLAAPDRQA